MTREEIAEAREAHEHCEGIGGAVFDWCDRCGVRWPCDDVVVLDQAEAYLSLVARIEQLQSTLARQKAPGKYEIPTLSVGTVFDMLQGLLMDPGCSGAASRATPQGFSETGIAIVNLMNAARAAGFARGRGLDDTEDNRVEDRALDKLKALWGAASRVPALTEEEQVIVARSRKAFPRENHLASGLVAIIDRLTGPRPSER